MKRTFKYALGMVLTAGMVMPAFAQDQFPDVPENHWAYEALLKMKQAGLLVGYPDGLYRGGRPASRYEMAVALYALYSRLKGITDGLQTQIDDLKTKAGSGNSGGPSQADFDALKAQVAQLSKDVAAMKGWGDEINKMKQMATTFEKELASMGVDVSKLQADMKDLAARVKKLEDTKMPIAFSGDVNLFGVATYANDSTAFGIDQSGRPEGVGKATGAPISGLGGLFDTLALFHESALTMTSTNEKGPTFKSTLVFGNLMASPAAARNGLTQGPTPITVGGGTPAVGPSYGESASGFYFQEFSIDYDTAVLGLGFHAKAGRFGYHTSALTFQRPDSTPYFTNDRWDSGDWTFDGAKGSFAFGGASVDVFLGRPANPMNSNGTMINGMFAGATAAPYTPSGVVGGGVPGTAGAPVGYVQRGALAVDRFAGANVAVPLGNMGAIDLSYIYFASNASNPVPQAGAGQLYNGVAVFGGDVKLGFNKFTITGAYGQSNLLDGSNSQLNKDNNAYNVKAAYDGGNWGLYAGYQYVAPLYGAPGDWGSIGFWHNPTDIMGVMVGGNIGLGSRLSLNADAGLYTGTDTSNSGLTKDDKVTALKVKVNYKLSDTWSAMLGWDAALWDLKARGAGIGGFAGGKPKENWYTLGLNFNMTEKAMFSLTYQISDYNGEGTTGWGGKARGGLVATQLTIKF